MPLISVAVVSLSALKSEISPALKLLSKPANPCLYVTPAISAETKMESKMLNFSKHSAIITRMLVTTGLENEQQTATMIATAISTGLLSMFFLYKF